MFTPTFVPIVGIFGVIFKYLLYLFRTIRRPNKRKLYHPKVVDVNVSSIEINPSVQSVSN